MPLQGRIASHMSYVVADLERAAHHWATTMGAGPFLVIERVAFDRVTHYGQPCIFDHAAAFGQWGPMVVELQQIYASAPSTLTEKLVPGPLPVINHLAYISQTPEEDSDALARAGHELFLHATFGPVEVRFHDTRSLLGQAVEIHRQSEFLDDFFARVAAASQNWSGDRLLRPWQ